MKREHSGPFLSAVFVDYDNIYMSLRRKSEDAAKRFAKDAGTWLRQIESGALITPTNGLSPPSPRRIVMNRCYGNPVPRRNASDNSTDMSSFPFVRHHFLRAGFEIVDCPPLTAQLKNSSDIRMVMDLRDYLGHETYFDEFVILSGDADFTPVLHRLRAHARRTIIYATEYTAVPYTAISDGEVREADLIALLLEGRATSTEAASPAPTTAAATPPTGIGATRRAILDDVVATVRAANAPVPLEVLADHAVRFVGHDRTIGTGWAGAGGFRELLQQGLPQGFRVSGEPPYVVIDTQRHIIHQPAAALPRAEAPVAPSPIERTEPRAERPAAASETDPYERPIAGRAQPAAQVAMASMLVPQAQATATPASARRPAPDAAALQTTASAPPRAEAPSAIQQSIARIHEACKAPPLAPPEYRALFEIIAQEITENGLIGAQTIQNIAHRAQERGMDVRRDDVRFVLEVVSEADPWFEQGASATLFAGRFRNFVVARCRAQGLTLTADELDLVEAWFAGSAAPPAQPARQVPPAPTFAAPPAQRATPAPLAEATYWSGDEGRAPAAEPRGRLTAPATAAQEPYEIAADDFPRIVRTRIRG
ncbi:MAG: NYN domain-containing protein [Hyphomicrobiaceae bacterium]|nr:NYN domain-containing protein [Hyphomicrobiaceae bacterium]